MTEGQDNLGTSKHLVKNYKNHLGKLADIEEKLHIIQDFQKQSEMFQVIRRQLLEKITEVKLAEPNTILEEKRVKFADEHESSKKMLKKTLSRTTSKPSIQKLQRSKTLYELLTNLHSWHGEINRKESEIEMLKARKYSLPVEEKNNAYEEMIRKLEIEKDELNERILHFVLLNVSEGREEYQDLISHLEYENKEMEDKMNMLQEQVHYLKETNIALMKENRDLRQAAAQGPNSLSLEALIEEKYRKSMIAGHNSTLLLESYLYIPMYQQNIGSSVQLLLDMEKEDKLSLDRESVDSFDLDTQIATWKMDDTSVHCKIKKLEQDLQEMEVIQMKLNLIKRYVRKHGTKLINRNTLIDLSNGTCLW